MTHKCPRALSRGSLEDPRGVICRAGHHCPLKVCRSSPERSHSRAVLSCEAVRTSLPLGEKMAEYSACVCPDNFRSNSPEGLQSLAVRSAEAVKTSVPPGENWTAKTGPVCASRILAHSPVFSSQILAVRSVEAVATFALSGDTA
eukprot:CAMPEP_0181401072 /NCGR_PEP_ID=MMETSP1110-20121109/2453_1 /TAXON_ID=174948 /ORGANISM="Symbiodinium sp., Strain CCMP421" /LENGTH=144 /DNA_ID=CAMNT_0023523213 /DNA_START=19 /DNA_END=449 /DNA_ORIENTATION=-